MAKLIFFFMVILINYLAWDLDRFRQLFVNLFPGFKRYFSLPSPTAGEQGDFNFLWHIFPYELDFRGGIGLRRL